MTDTNLVLHALLDFNHLLEHLCFCCSLTSGH